MQSNLKNGGNASEKTLLGTLKTGMEREHSCRAGLRSEKRAAY